MRLGIRAQLVIWLAALLALAFAPLFFAIANLARANFTRTWEQQSRALGRAIAAHVSEARSHRAPDELDALLEVQLGPNVGAVGIYDPGGKLVKLAGVEDLPSQIAPQQESVERVTTSRGPALVITVPSAEGAVAALLHTDPSAVRVQPLVQLIALYIGILGLGLLFVAYVMMTRVVVSPIEKLSRAASKVAEGARELEVPKAGGRELVDLGMSLASMTATLRSEEEQLRDKVSELKQAQDTLIRSERLASVGRLAAGLAHEIGNPVAAILALQELLLDGELDDDQRDFAERMKRETERVNGILRDLLDFARPAAEGSSDTIGIASVKDAVEHVVALVTPQKSLHEVELLVEIDAGLPAVAMRPERVEQVVLNLVLNAADVVPRPEGRIRVGARKVPNGVAIAIEDNGGGIAPSVRGRLFEPFVTTKEVGKGTGLGLAVCRGLGGVSGRRDRGAGRGGWRSVCRHDSLCESFVRRAFPCGHPSTTRSPSLRAHRAASARRSRANLRRG